MTARRGLTAQIVIAAAAELVDAEGVSALTFSRVARELGVKPPSLYNHVDSLESLRRDLALHVFDELSELLGVAAMGRSGKDGLQAVADAIRRYTSAHPGLYLLSAETRIDDDELVARSFRAVEPVMAILRGFNLDDDEAIHAARTLRAAIHGFVSLERTGGFGLDVDVDASFAWLVDRLAETIETTVKQ